MWQLVIIGVAAQCNVVGILATYNSQSDCLRDLLLASNPTNSPMMCRPAPAQKGEE